MVVSNVRLYEALKPTVGEDAARMVAEVLPLGADVATKQDVYAVREDVVAVKAEVADLKADVADVKADVADVKTEVADVKADVATLKHELVAVEARLGKSIAQVEARIQRLLLTFIVPMWITVFAALIAVVLKT